MLASANHLLSILQNVPGLNVPLTIGEYPVGDIRVGRTPMVLVFPFNGDAFNTSASATANTMQEISQFDIDLLYSSVGKKKYAEKLDGMVKLSELLMDEILKEDNKVSADGKVVIDPDGQGVSWLGFTKPLFFESVGHAYFGARFRIDVMETRGMVC